MTFLLQGRFGDSLNPWADMISIAQAWCVSKPDAVLAIGTETALKSGDLVRYNAGRYYGPTLYPFLVTNWKYKWPQGSSFTLEIFLT